MTSSSLGTLAAAALAAASLLAAPAGAQEERRDTVRLQELVVSAAGWEQDRAQASASVTVITAENLRTRRVASLAEAVGTVEGIDVGGSVGKTGGASISMRGMPSEYTLVLVDGRRQNAAGNVTPNGFGETSTSFLPPLSAIERVEVIRGPMATLYGSDAMGGVINLITRRVGTRWSGSFGTDATVQTRDGFGNAYSGNLYATGPVAPGLLGVTLRGRAYHRAASELAPTGEHAPGTEISRRGDSPVEADVYSLGGRATLTPGRAHELWLDVERARQRYDNAEAQLGTLDRPDGDPPAFNGYGPELRFHRDEATLAHAWRGGRIAGTSSWMVNRTATIGRTIPVGTPGGPPGSGAPDRAPGSPRALEVENTVLDTRWTYGARGHAVTVGGQHWRARMVDGVALAPFRHAQWALFAEDEWRLAAPLALTVGVRRDAHSSFGAQVSPRAYLVWSASGDWTFKGGVSRGYKTPRLEQLVDGVIGFTGQGRTAVIGTPTLRPETSTTAEVAAYYTAIGGASASLTFFENRFRDRIARGTPVANCTFAAAPDRPGCVDHGSFPTQEFFAQSVNVDRAMTRGVEAGARLPLGIWTASASYTLTRSEQQSGDAEGFPLTDTPRHMLNGELRAAPGERLAAWLRGEHRSSRARRTTAAANPAWEALGDYRAYTLLHLGGSYRVGPLTVSAAVQNLLGTDFLRFAAYEVEPSASNPAGVEYTSLYNNHQEGRRVWIGTSVDF